MELTGCRKMQSVVASLMKPSNSSFSTHLAKGRSKVTLIDCIPWVTTIQTCHSFSRPRTSMPICFHQRNMGHNPMIHVLLTKNLISYPIEIRSIGLRDSSHATYRNPRAFLNATIHSKT